MQVLRTLVHVRSQNNFLNVLLGLEEDDKAPPRFGKEAPISNLCVSWKTFSLSHL